MTSNIPIRASQAKDYLKEILECPVCYNVPNDGPIFQGGVLKGIYVKRHIC